MGAFFLLSSHSKISIQCIEIQNQVKAQNQVHLLHVLIIGKKSFFLTFQHNFPYSESVFHLKYLIACKIYFLCTKIYIKKLPPPPNFFNFYTFLYITNEILLSISYILNYMQYVFYKHMGIKQGKGTLKIISFIITFFNTNLNT